VVAGNEVPARPAQNRHTPLSGCAHNIFAKTLLVRKVRVLLVDTSVHAPANMLDEGSVDLGVDWVVDVSGVN
jgi:hypothetical protein